MDEPRFTRRGFIQLGSGALAAGSVLRASGEEDVVASPAAAPEQGGLSGKIALEEHFDFSATENASYGSFGGPEFQRQIKDLGSGRIAETDRGGIEICILSLVGVGIQAILNPSRAVEVARRANDHLAEGIVKHPKGLRDFAPLPLQEKCCKPGVDAAHQGVGVCGALVNGFTQSGDADRSHITTCRSFAIFGLLSNTLMCLFIFTLVPLCPRISLLIKVTHG